MNDEQTIAEQHDPTSDAKGGQSKALDVTTISLLTDGKSPQNTEASETENEPAKGETVADQAQPARRLSRTWGWIRKGTTSTDWFIVLLTAVIAGTSYLQWRVIRSGSSDTHDLAVAAKTQAEKMKSMSDAADKIRQAAQDMVLQDQRIADNARESLEAGKVQNNATLDASRNQSAASLDATVASSHLEQRAWLVPSGFRLSGEPTRDTGVSVTVSIINTGKTPALELINQSKLFLLNVDPPGVNFELPANPRSRAMVAPGISGVEFKTDSLTLKTLGQISFYTSLLYKIYLQALIRYKDTFNQDHWTAVCAYHVSGASLDSFQYCEHGNEVDGEQPKKAN